MQRMCAHMYEGVAVSDIGQSMNATVNCRGNTGANFRGRLGSHTSASAVLGAGICTEVHFRGRLGSPTAASGVLGAGICTGTHFRGRLGSHPSASTVMGAGIYTRCPF